MTETPIVPPPGPAAQGADLVLRKFASTDSAHPGEQVLYALAVKNRGPDNATGVTISDPAPAGLFPQTARPSQGSCTINGVGLTCHLGAIRNGGGAVVLVEATLARDATGRVSNMASVSGDQRDPHPASAIARNTIRVVPWPTPPAPPTPPAEPVSSLHVRKHVSRRTARVGQRVRYTITVTNTGPDAAPDVRLIDSPRLPLRVVSIHTRHGRCLAATPIRCRLGRLASGARVTVTINTVATHAGRQANAAVAISGSWNPDPNASVASARTRILPARHPPRPHPRPRPRPRPRPGPPLPRVTG